MISSFSYALESYWGIEVIGLLVFTLGRILHTCTHRITCAEYFETKKGRLGPQKWPAGLEKMKVIAIIAQILMSRHITLVFRSLAPHPCMDTIGCQANSRDETVIKENTNINLESELIETLKASENKHRFRRFHRRWKAIGELR